MNFFGSKFNNKGISLIELVVVISIMTILSASAGIGISLVSGRPAQSASNKWATRLERIRTVGMGKDTADTTIEIKNDGIYVYETVCGNTAESSKVSGANVTCTVAVVTAAGANEIALKSGDKVVVEFNRADGSLKSVKCNGTEEYYSSAKPSDVCFSFMKAGKLYEVHIVPVTGRVVCEKK